MSKKSKPTATQPLEGFKHLEPRSPPIQQRSRETVERILENAAELVDEVGVVGFTTNLLAERADVRIRTIYRYFPSKLGILSALMHHLNADSEKRFVEISKLSEPGSDWRKIICTWIDDQLQWTRERPGVRLLMGWSSNVPELLALQDHFDEEWTERMMDALRARGTRVPNERLYAICRTFNETIDSMTSLAAWYDGQHASELIEEAKLMLVHYLERYLD
jgi:AcrR family transcriptional regulator